MKNVMDVRLGLVVLLMSMVAMSVGCASSGINPYAQHKTTSESISQRGGFASTASYDNISSTDEVWVIVRDESQLNQSRQEQYNDDYPGTGSMVSQLRGQESHVPLPLKHTQVKAAISGYIATINVEQQFHNPYSEKIEAVYVFPLPQDAAVNDFVMTIGDRKIRGIIRDRAEAERIYEQAKRQGYRASLMTQQRPNVFTQKVANIEPGKQIGVKISYFSTLRYVDGWYEFIFPMVVGPRFNPGGNSDPIGAMPRHKTHTTRHTAVGYLKPAERSGHDIDLSVEIDAGVKLHQIESVTHDTTITELSPSRARVQLSRHDRLPNRDFILRYRVADQKIASSLMTWRDPSESDAGYFTMMIYPPAELKRLARQPLEMIFVLDCSGSMSGKPMSQSKQAMRAALGRMNKGDTFQVIRFSESASSLGSRPLAATPGNIATAMRYVDRLQGQGGTHMLAGIRASLDYRHDKEKLRYVCFLTDGLLSNEKQVLREMQQRIGDARVFSFGVGSAPNRYLMHRMAKIGRGSVAFIPEQANGADVMNAFFDRISHPAMIDLSIHFGNMQVSDVYPKRFPDLYVGRPVIVSGRFKGKGKTQVVINGRTGGKTIQMGTRVDLDQASSRHRGIAPVWARRKIAELNDEYLLTRAAYLPRQIKQVALDHNLVSDYTAFVAVDVSRKTSGRTGTTVHQAVPVPSGVKYETTVE